MKKKIIFILLTFAIIIVAVESCTTYQFRSNYTDSNNLIHNTINLQTKPFLKAHLKNGDIWILKDSWKIDTILNIVSGTGTKYDFNRNKVFEDSISIPIDNVAIFETNTKIQNPEAGRITALGILTGVDVIVGVICITNPKACYGSCPTFYMNENDNFHYADAEGFTNAISPSMEYFDIDALNNELVSGNVFSITMKNEALETHCVNDVKLFAYPRKPGERVYQSPTDQFYLCKNNYPVTQALADEGDITVLVNQPDANERFSYTDESNLNSKEEIYLNFDNVKDIKDLGLILNFRQTLLTTYLFYNAMGYMGNHVGDVFALLENDSQIRNNFDTLAKVLGGIDVYLMNESTGQWILHDRFNEAGPIAINKQFIPLQNLPALSKVKLKIILNRGLWRLDYAALTNITDQVKPIELSPESIYNKGELDNIALSTINNPEKYLISMPGSEYKFNFKLPDSNTDYELFLYSKGYYLEWMREHWIKDENLLKLRQMLLNPKKYLKEEAKNYKVYETQMEQEFWNSRIDTKIFSYHEN